LANGKAENASAVDGVSTISMFAERHFSPKALATLWGLSTDAVRRLFRHEEGIVLIPRRRHCLNSKPQSPQSAARKLQHDANPRIRGEKSSR
jgi:hypothetical protein